MNATASLISAAEAAAVRIEKEAAEGGVTFGAEQSFYGVEVEILVGDDWVRLSDTTDEQRAEVEAVRLFDCDGNRGAECRTAEEVDADVETWLP